jgi:hypothetical protein
MKRRFFPALVLALSFLFLSGRCHRAVPIEGSGPGASGFDRPDRRVEGRPGEAGAALLAPGRYAAILVSDFTDDSPWPDFPTGAETAAYFVAQMAPRFDGTVSRWSGPAAAPPGGDRAVALTGSAALTRIQRKALRRRAAPVDGPFKVPGGELDEQAVYTLEISVKLSASDEVLFERKFKETRVYEDIEKPPDFALYELLDRVRAELFPVLFGTLERRR